MNERLKVFKLNKLKKPISHQSQEWVRRHLNDPFVKKARKDGYICRAAYKLFEIQEKYKLIRPFHNIVELGSAPGGWSQVVTDILDEGKIFAIDLQEMKFCHNSFHFIQGDFIEEQEQIIYNIKNVLDGSENNKIHGLISDIAPAACGDKQVNHWRIMELCRTALEFAKPILNKKGYFIAKIFMGDEEKDFIQELKRYFEKVEFFKPKSSRKDSTEIYVIARGFFG